MTRLPDHYSTFSWSAGAVLLSWLSVQVSAALAVRAHLLYLWKMEDLPSAFEMHTLQFRPGYDLVFAAALAIILIALRRLLRSPKGSWGVDAVGFFTGLLLVLVVVLMPALILSGRLPPIGMAPNRWPATIVFVLLAMAVLHAPRLVVRRISTAERQETKS